MQVQSTGLSIYDATDDIVQSTTAPTPATAGLLWLDISVSPEQLKRYNGDKWINCSPIQSDLDDITKRVKDAESSIEQTTESIKTLVTKTEYETNNTDVTSKISDLQSITQQTSESIKTLVTKTEYTENNSAIQTSLSEMQTSINANAESLSFKVSKTEMDKAINEKLSYVLTIISTSDVLSDAIRVTTLTAKVMLGKDDVTTDFDASKFEWTRTSSDSTADTLWNNSHKGIKSIQLGVLDVSYCATYACDLIE